MTLKIGSLFSGTGALDMAVAEVFGAETAWFCEFNKHAAKILEHHWPDVPNHRDVSAVDWSKVEPVDIITGGSPCQDLSNAGKRAGMVDGTRSNLWVAMRDAIDALRPTYVVWENVRGALSAKAQSASDLEPGDGQVGDGRVNLRALGRVLGDLAEMGYDAQWGVVRASDAGACHRRERVFVLAHLSDSDGDVLGQLAGASPEQEGRPDEGDRSADSRGGSRTGVTLLPTPAVNDMGASYTPDEWDAWTARMKAKHGNGNGHGKSLNVEAQRLLPTPQARDHKDGELKPAAHRPQAKDSVSRAIAHLPPTPVADNSRGLVSDSTEFQSLPNEVAYRWGEYGDAIQHWEKSLGRPAPPPTEPAAKGGPRLSPRFVEWMMGLPDGHVTDPAIGVSRTQQLKALGNGVVPQQATLALLHLLPIAGGVRASA